MKDSVTWVLVILGWVVVHYLAVVRERQNDAHKQVQELVTSLYDLEAAAIAFHQNPTFDGSVARSLLSKVDRIARALAQPPLRKLNVPTFSRKTLRQSITLRNFDQSSFQPQAESSSLLAGVSVATQRVIEEVEEALATRFHERWWQVFRV